MHTSVYGSCPLKISTTVKIILKTRDRPTDGIIYWTTFTATAIKKETFRRIYEKFQKGAVNIEHGRLGVQRLTEKTKDCIAWLEFFINCVGQHQPDQKTIHLPSCFTLLSIYKQMVQEHDSLSIASVGLSQFYRIFNQYFPHVSIPKVTTVLYIMYF